MARKGWLGAVIPLIMVVYGLARLYRDAKGRITLATARGLRRIIAGIKLLKRTWLSDCGNTGKRLIIVRNHY